MTPYLSARVPEGMDTNTAVSMEVMHIVTNCCWVQLSSGMIHAAIGENMKPV